MKLKSGYSRSETREDWQRYCTAVEQWASAKLCVVVFGRAAIMWYFVPHLLVVFIK